MLVFEYCTGEAALIFWSLAIGLSRLVMLLHLEDEAQLFPRTECCVYCLFCVALIDTQTRDDGQVLEVNNLTSVIASNLSHVTKSMNMSVGRSPLLVPEIGPRYPFEAPVFGTTVTLLLVVQPPPVISRHFRF
jgi:hypothetical protein